MKMKFTKVLLLVLLPFIGICQTDIQWSGLHSGKTQLFGTVTLDNSIYMVKVNTNGVAFTKKNNTSILKYDKNLKLEGEFTHSLKFGGKKAVFTELVSIDGKLWLLSTGVNSSGE